MTGTKILLLEDDILYQDSIKEFLKDENFIVETCDTGEEFLNKIFENVYDLYIIDINVPQPNGFEIMNLLRDYNDTTLKLVLTSIPNTIIQSFKNGCDDFINKNTDIEEILLRVKNLVRSSYHTYKEIINITDNITYNLFNKQLYNNKKLINVEISSLQILDYLIKHRGKFVSNTEIETNIYPTNSKSKANVIRYHIWNLRNTLGKNIIESRKNIGYKLKPLGI